MRLVELLVVATAAVFLGFTSGLQWPTGDDPAALDPTGTFLTCGNVEIDQFADKLVIRIERDAP